MTTSLLPDTAAVAGGRLAVGGVALDGGGQLAGGIHVLAGRPDVGHEAAQGELGRVEDSEEAEQAGDHQRQGQGHRGEDDAGAHRCVMSGDG